MADMPSAAVPSTRRARARRRSAAPAQRRGTAPARARVGASARPRRRRRAAAGAGAPASSPQQLGDVGDERRRQRQVALLVGAAVGEEHPLGGARDGGVEQIALAGERSPRAGADAARRPRQLTRRSSERNGSPPARARELPLLQTADEHRAKPPGADLGRLGEQHLAARARPSAPSAGTTAARRAARSARRPAGAARARPARPARATRAASARASSASAGGQLRGRARCGAASSRRASRHRRLEPGRRRRRRARRAPRAPSPAPPGLGGGPQSLAPDVGLEPVGDLGRLQQPGRAQVGEQIAGGRLLGRQQRAAGRARAAPGPAGCGRTGVSRAPPSAIPYCANTRATSGAAAAPGPVDDDDLARRARRRAAAPAHGRRRARPRPARRRPPAA